MIIFLVTASFLLVFMLDKYQISLVQARTILIQEEQADIIKLKFENAINNRINNTDYLNSLFSLHPDTTAEQFSFFAENLIKINPSVRALQFADKATQVVYVYPPENNQITIAEPMVLIKDPVRGKYVEKAINERRMTVQPPFKLRQGGIGFVARNPIFINGEFFGLSIAVINADDIIKDSFEAADQASFYISISDSEGHAFFNSSECLMTYAAERIINFADSNWILKLQGTGHDPAAGRPRRMLIDFLSFCILLLCVLLVYFYMRRAEFLKNEVNKKMLELEHSESRFKRVIDNTKAGYFKLDLNGSFVEVNRAWLELHGYDDESEVAGRHFSITQPEDHLSSAEHIVGGVLNGKEIANSEFPRLCRDGSIRYHTYTASPVSINGKIEGLEGFIFDITELKTAEQEKDFLMKEMNHRVKNNLLLVTSLVNLKDISLGDAVDLTDIKNQIKSIMLIHEKLYQSGDMSKIRVKDYFIDLLDTIFSAFTAEPVEVITEIDDVSIEVKDAVTLGLLVNEIATNAVKHAYNHASDGWFRFDFRKDSAAAEYVMKLSNSGIPFPENTGLNHPETLGLRLISSLTAQIHGVIELHKSPKTMFIIRIPDQYLSIS